MTNTEGNTGWADAMSKILVVKKPKKNKTIILSKGKKLSLMKLKNSDNESTAEENNINPLSNSKQKEIFMKGRIKPNIFEKDKEKRLQRITVKGVVKLFNAVNKHQRNNNTDKIDTSGPVMTKKEKLMNSVSKSTFLNYLMGDVKEENVTENDDVKMEIKEEDELELDEQSKAQNSTWEVLQSNYGIGVKLKNWDNKSTEQIDL